jgi:hypothetical protein
MGVFGLVLLVLGVVVRGAWSWGPGTLELSLIEVSRKIIFEKKCWYRRKIRKWRKYL